MSQGKNIRQGLERRTTKKTSLGALLDDLGRDTHYTRRDLSQGRRDRMSHKGSRLGGILGQLRV